MRRGGPRPIVALLATALAVAAAGCGGSGSDSSTGDSTAKTTAKSKGGGSGKEPSGSSRGPGGKSKSGDGSGNGSSGGGSGSGSADVATPLKVSGGGSKQFRFKGGDNSIQEWGEEQGEDELRAAAEAVHGFYVARAEQDWSRACTYLAESMVNQLKQLAAQSPNAKDLTCAQVLKAFTRPLPPSVARKTTIVDAGSLRDDGEHAFLIYYDSEHKPYAIPLEDEDGEWRLTLLSATPLG